MIAAASSMWSGSTLRARRARSSSRARGCRRSPRAGAARRAPSPRECARAPRPRRCRAARRARRTAASTSGKSHCTALSSSRSTSSSSSSGRVSVVTGAQSRAVGASRGPSRHPAAAWTASAVVLVLTGVASVGMSPQRDRAAPRRCRRARSGASPGTGVQGPHLGHEVGHAGDRRSRRSRRSRRRPGCPPAAAGLSAPTSVTRTPPPWSVDRVAAGDPDPAVTRLAGPAELVGDVAGGADRDRDAQPVGARW